MSADHEIQIQLFANFFILAIALVTLYINYYRLHVALRQSKILQRKSEQYERLCQTTSEGVFSCTVEFQFLMVNRAGLEMLGYASLDELHSTKVNLLDCFKTRNDRNKIKKNIISGAGVQHAVVKIKCPNEACQFLDVTAHLREDENECVIEGIFYDVTSRINLEDELRQHREHLEELVQERTKTLEKANVKISQHERELKNLSFRLIRAQEGERKRISSQLHDGTTQDLSVIKFQIDAMRDKLASGDFLKATQNLAQIDALIDDIMKQVHEVAINLRPKMLDDLGLIATLQWLIKGYMRNNSIDIHLHAEGMVERLEPELETFIYRIVQEGVTNMIKHARAKTAKISLIKKSSYIRVLIEDFGRGLPANKEEKSKIYNQGLGLISIRENVSLLGGTFTLQSEQGKGTRLQIKLPINGN